MNLAIDQMVTDISSVTACLQMKFVHTDKALAIHANSESEAFLKHRTTLLSVWTSNRSDVLHNIHDDLEQ